MIKRFRVTWGRPADMGDHPDELHCFSCGHILPGRAATQCGECAHAWRWGWLLSLHDLRVDWKLMRRFRPRRSSNIYVCPCCAHDF